jgi:hypothetical protein
MAERVKPKLRSLVAVFRPTQHVNLFSQTHMGNMFRLKQLAIIRPHTEKRTSKTFRTLLLGFFWRWDTSGIHTEKL